MKKLIYLLLGILFFPVIIFIIVVAIPLFLLFLLFLKMLTFRLPRRAPRPQPSQSRKIHQSDEVVDIECEVIDDDKK
jgi:hypothetical protein